jgi:hypothetical protein
LLHFYRPTLTCRIFLAVYDLLFAMRRLLIVLTLMTAGLARAETPVLLDSAIQKLIADDDHWAFTQTFRRIDKAGRPQGGLYVERYDPSKPFDQQWRLVKFNGRTPTALELDNWRRAKLRALSRGEDRFFLDKLDFEHATLFGETAETATFLVPIFKNASRRLPADKIEVFMTVDKARGALVAFSLQPRESFRVAGILKLESGFVDGRLEVVNQQYPPALTSVRGSGSLRLLGFFHIGVAGEQDRTDYQRVRPYNDRFSVKIGDVKALDF